MIGTMTNPAEGSAHHQPKSAFRSKAPDRIVDRYRKKRWYPVFLLNQKSGICEITPTSIRTMNTGEDRRSMIPMPTGFKVGSSRTRRYIAVVRDADSAIATNRSRSATVSRA
jgi:hypothetical protein